jgi:hypothetical protein
LRRDIGGNNNKIFLKISKRKNYFYHVKIVLFLTIFALAVFSDVSRNVFKVKFATYWNEKCEKFVDKKLPFSSFDEVKNGLPIHLSQKKLKKLKQLCLPILQWHQWLQCLRTATATATTTATATSLQHQIRRWVQWDGFMLSKESITRHKKLSLQCYNATISILLCLYLLLVTQGVERNPGPVVNKDSQDKIISISTYL